MTGGWAQLTERLRARESEAKHRVAAVIRSLPGAADPMPRSYISGLHAAIAEAIDFALNSLEAGSEPVAPAAVLDQARRAARAEVGVHTVIRRIAAGDRVLAEVLVDEARGLPDAAVREARRRMSDSVDGLMAVVAEEYEREAAKAKYAPTDMRFTEVCALLAGDRVESSTGDYPMEAWHLALVSDMSLSERAVLGLARKLGFVGLVVHDVHDRTWGWLGSPSPFATDDLEAALSRLSPEPPALAVGEARYGLDGWRLTHEEAICALEFQSSDRAGVVRARKVLVPVAVLRDATLTRSLLASYVEPLTGGPERSANDLIQTLQAYLASGQNTTTAAARLSVDRHTVQRRVKLAEDLLGQRIEDCHVELGAAIRVADGNTHDEALTPPETRRRALGWADRRPG